MDTAGQQLKAAREIKGISLKTAAQKTKISRQVLELLEADKWDKINSPEYYVKSFLKLYARYLHLDYGSLLENWQQQAKIPKPGSESPSLQQKRAKYLPIRRALRSSGRRLSQIREALASCPRWKIIVGATSLGVLVVLGAILTWINASPSPTNPSALGEQTPDNAPDLLGEPGAVYILGPGQIALDQNQTAKHAPRSTNEGNPL